VDEALIACRFVHFTAAMLLFGIGIFQSVVAPSKLAARLARPLRRMVAWSAAIIVITAVLWLSLQTGEMGEGWPDASNPDTVLAALTGTTFGQAWQWHLGFALVLAVLVLAGRTASWHTVSLLAAVLLGSLGFVGHAASHTGGAGWLHVGNQALHLLTAGAWLGSLVPIVYCLRLMEQDAIADGMIAIRRFSVLGHAAVAAVIATGAFEAYLVLGTWPADLSSSYRMYLFIKIGLVLAMIALALFNRYVLLPRSRHDPEPALRALRRCTLAEIAAGLGVLAAVSVLGTLEPA
jgi:putative copper resistance protein D